LHHRACRARWLLPYHVQTPDRLPNCSLLLPARSGAAPPPVGGSVPGCCITSFRVVGQTPRLPIPRYIRGGFVPEPAAPPESRCEYVLRTPLRRPSEWRRPS